MNEIAVVEAALAAARERYRIEGPTHANTDECERLFAKLQKLKKREAEKP